MTVRAADVDDLARLRDDVPDPPGVRGRIRVDVRPRDARVVAHRDAARRADDHVVGVVGDDADAEGRGLVPGSARGLVSGTAGWVHVWPPSWLTLTPESGLTRPSNSEVA